eukprot:Gb_15053 [translate_table: standard]
MARDSSRAARGLCGLWRTAGIVTDLAEGPNGSGRVDQVRPTLWRMWQAKGKPWEGGSRLWHPKTEQKPSPNTASESNDAQQLNTFLNKSFGFKLKQRGRSTLKNTMEKRKPPKTTPKNH